MMNQNWKRTKELAGYFAEQLKSDGILPTAKKTAGFVKRRFFGKKARFLPLPKVLEKQRQTDFTGWPTISICVPLYNTPKEFFDQLLTSVQNQTCPCWQLCFADASDQQHTQVGEWAQDACKKDKRIRYMKIQNKGIS